jgi:hypothetical protein
LGFLGKKTLHLCGLSHLISSAGVIPVVSSAHDFMAFLALHLEGVLTHLNDVANFVESEAIVVLLT